jgi:hypothetical protein
MLNPPFPKSQLSCHELRDVDFATDLIGRMIAPQPLAATKPKRGETLMTIYDTDIDIETRRFRKRKQ